MEQIQELKVGDCIKINESKYKVKKINIVKMGKCFKMHYGNTWEIDLIDEENNPCLIKLNGNTIGYYSIEIL